MDAARQRQDNCEQQRMERVTLVALRPHQQYLGKGQMLRMGNGQERRTRSQGVESRLRAPMKLQLGGAAVSNNLNTAPQNVLAVASAKGLHRGFLRSKSSGEMNGGHPPPVAVRHLAIGKDTVEESFAVSCNRVGNTADIGGIEAGADNLGHVEHDTAVALTGVQLG
jgi:hypothetical protein